MGIGLVVGVLLGILFPLDVPNAKEEFSNTLKEEVDQGQTLFLRFFRSDGTDGLGPYFQRQSCASCHFGLGPGTSLTRGAAGLPVNGGHAMAFFVPGHPQERVFEQALPGLPPPEPVSVTYRSVRLQTAAGILQLEQPTFRDASNRPLAARRAMGLAISGVIDGIPAEWLHARALLQAQSDDGVAGQVRVLEDGRVGRFGWTAAVATLEDQVRSAFRLEMGIEAHELEDGRIRALAAFLRQQAASLQPLPVGSLATGHVFYDSGCAACHVPNLAPTGKEDAGWSLFSDLLLHDMGKGLADPDGQAQFRTQPLVGKVAPLGKRLGVLPKDRRRFLHDGRARSVAEAIAWHGGEAQGARDAFLALSPEARSRLLLFVDNISGLEAGSSD